ncbi:MAG: ester cyclase [Saprospiraceae bacterium]|nr:ester cyclase [Saprospiraceae bacterium]
MKTLLSLALFLLLGVASVFAQTPAQNKETTRKILAAIDAGDLAAFSMYVSPALVEHMPPPPGLPSGLSDFEKTKMLIGDWHKAFPDSHTEVINIAAEGNLVIVHSRWSATNTAPFMGMSATNKKVSIEQTDIIRFDAAGKGVEHWAVIDQLGMMQQLGWMPAEGK